VTHSILASVCFGEHLNDPVRLVKKPEFIELIGNPKLTLTSLERQLNKQHLEPATFAYSIRT
jgi:hypothetical protein